MGLFHTDTQLLKTEHKRTNITVIETKNKKPQLIDPSCPFTLIERKKKRENAKIITN